MLTQGFATLMVNYRGSTGYGQKFADAIFKDQNGGEAKDVVAGVDAAVSKYAWIDRDRLGIEGGSYGGQLTNWIITQTDRFKAAVPAAGISNLVSFNYMAYYHDYLAVEFGSFPHENGLMDLLWERSPIRYVHKVKTPVMFVHGENDNDVPIAEAEQYYIALRDAGVKSIMVRYPREGHGVRETKHVIDVIDRSIQWYREHFTRSGDFVSRSLTRFVGSSRLRFDGGSRLRFDGSSRLLACGRALALTLAVLAAPGCLVVSLHPSYDADSLGWDPALLGAWENAEDRASLQIERADWKSVPHQVRVSHRNRRAHRLPDGRWRRSIPRRHARPRR